MAVDIKDVPPSTLQTTANPAATTLSSGNIVDIVLTDAVTGTPSTALTVEHGTSGTPAAGVTPEASFGVRIEFKLDDTVNAKQTAARIIAYWRAVGAALANDSGVLAMMVQTSGSVIEGARFQDYQAAFVAGNTTNPGIGYLADNRMGIALNGGGAVAICHTSVQVLACDTSAGTPRTGFNGSSPVAKPNITGSRGGNAALASLLTNMATQGLITDGTTA